MTSSGPKPRNPWLDRFRTPSTEGLIEALPRQCVPAFLHARTRLVSIDGLTESLSWRGVWHWTLAYGVQGRAELACAYLIPDPERPRLCIMIAEDRLTDLPLRKLSKAVRESVVHAPPVNGVRWPVWAIHSKAQIDELLPLIEVRFTETSVVPAASS